MSVKRILFIDRDGTLIKEAPPTYQLDSFAKLEFYPHVFKYMREIASLDFELVMVTNQDGLGTPAFPDETFWPVHDFVMTAFKNEGVHFSEVCIDRSFISDKSPMRKPGTGMLSRYINDPSYDIHGSYVIGDRITDMELAKNLGCKGLWLNNDKHLGASEITISDSLQQAIVVETTDWEQIYQYLKESEAQQINS